MEELTKKEHEVLKLLTIEYLSPKRASIRLKISTQAIYKYIKILRQKGELKSTIFEMVAKDTPYTPPLPPLLQPKGQKDTPLLHMEQIRLHGLQITLKIIYNSEFYINFLKSSNIINIGDNTINLYKEVMDIYIKPSFYGENPINCLNKAFLYLNEFILKLEAYFRLTLIKERYNNMSIKDWHFSHINNDLAKQCNINKEKIKIKTNDDKRIWFMIDNSFNLHEAETIGRDAKQDMQQVIQPFFNDLKYNEPVTLSQIKEAIKDIADANLETARGLSSVVELLKPKREESNIKKEDFKIDYIN